MFTLVICLVFIILRAEANVLETDNPEIRLPFMFDRNENYTVWKDKPLKIIIENGYARYVWCDNYYRKIVDGRRQSEKFVPPTEFAYGNIQILNITNVTDAMSTRWECTVLQEYHGPATPYIFKNRKYTAKKSYFLLYVKGASETSLVYYISAVGGAVLIILVIILYLSYKKHCCCIRSRLQELQPVPTPRLDDPATVYYQNLLSVFQPINEREAAEMENHYEEVQ